MEFSWYLLFNASSLDSNKGQSRLATLLEGDGLAFDIKLFILLNSFKAVKLVKNVKIC